MGEKKTWERKNYDKTLNSFIIKNCIFWNGHSSYPFKRICELHCLKTFECQVTSASLHEGPRIKGVSIGRKRRRKGNDGEERKQVWLSPAMAKTNPDRNNKISASLLLKADSYSAVKRYPKIAKTSKSCLQTYFPKTNTWPPKQCLKSVYCSLD